MGKYRQFYGINPSCVPITLSPKVPSVAKQQEILQAMQNAQQKHQLAIAQIQQSSFGQGGKLFQSAAELDHELTVRKARAACDFLERITMITREEKASYHSMLISKDHDSNVLAIAIIDEKVGELTDLVQMYQSGVAPQLETKIKEDGSSG